MTTMPANPTPAEGVVVTFGDVVVNGWASEDNPTRTGYFVRSFTRTGKMNPGLTWEVTDGKGKFWTFKPADIGERLTVLAARPAAPTQSAAQTGEVEQLRAALERIQDWLRYEVPVGTRGATVMLTVVNNALSQPEQSPTTQEGPNP